MRRRSWATRSSSSATSGTTRLAASVGVEARTSATRSSSGVSGLVADRADDRRAAGGDRADQRLVGERQQVLERAAAAGDDDDVDLGVGVEPLQRGGDLGHGVRALHRHLLDAEPHRRPAPAAVLDDVLLGGRRPAADDADDAGQERQRPLAVGGEQALGGEHRAQLLEPGEQLADADLADLVGGQRQRAARRRRTAACACTTTCAPSREPGGRPVEQRDRAGDGQRHVGARVAQGEERRCAGPAAG